MSTENFQPNNVAPQGAPTQGMAPQGMPVQGMAPQPVPVMVAAPKKPKAPVKKPNKALKIILIIAGAALLIGAIAMFVVAHQQVTNEEYLDAKDASSTNYQEYQYYSSLRTKYYNYYQNSYSYYYKYYYYECYYYANKLANTYYSRYEDNQAVVDNYEDLESRDRTIGIILLIFGAGVLVVGILYGLVFPREKQNNMLPNGQMPVGPMGPMGQPMMPQNPQMNGQMPQEKTLPPIGGQAPVASTPVAETTTEETTAE